MATELRIVLVTAPSVEKAREIATTVVEEKLCACVNVLPVLSSIYRWEGKICDESEVLMVIKTSFKNLTQLESRVKSLHPYTVPEFVVLNTEYVSESYLRWALA